MKTLNYIVVLALLLSFSCNKQNETQLNPINKTNIPGDFAESTGLFYFDIPVEHKSNNSEISTVQKVEELISIEGLTFSVLIELSLGEDGKMISLGVSDDFCSYNEINNINLIIDNLETFNNHINSPERPQRGWLGRFFLGRVVHTPCVLGARNWLNDPWWGGTYGGGVEGC